VKYRDVIYPIVLTALESLKNEIDTEFNRNQNNDDLGNILFELDGHTNKVQKIISGDLEDLCLNEILSYFYNLEVVRILKPIGLTGIRKLSVVLIIAKILEESQSLSMGSEIDFPVASFKIVVDKGPEVPFKFFGFFNSGNKIDSIGYFNFRENWSDDLFSTNFDSALLSCALYLFGHDSSLTFEQAYIIVRADASDNKSIQATLRLQAVAHGIPIHSAVGSGVIPSCIAPPKISALQPYQQFNESILILSEYHSRKEILNKFLSLYHVIESFMYKIPIAKLGSNNAGKMFSIRDFRALYRNVANNELNSIKEIFKGFWSLQISGTSFKDIVKNELIRMPTLFGFDNAEFNLLLTKLDVAENNGFTQLKNSTSTQNGTSILYATLLYKVRCAIVHNSETEFHISHYNLSKTLIHTLDELLMKPLEILILDQIADPSSPVWYKVPSLKLYEV